VPVEQRRSSPCLVAPQLRRPHQSPAYLGTAACPPQGRRFPCASRAGWTTDRTRRWWRRCQLSPRPRQWIRSSLPRTDRSSPPPAALLSLPVGPPAARGPDRAKGGLLPWALCGALACHRPGSPESRLPHLRQGRGSLRAPCPSCCAPGRARRTLSLKTMSVIATPRRRSWRLTCASTWPAARASWPWKRLRRARQQLRFIVLADEWQRAAHAS